MLGLLAVSLGLLLWGASAAVAGGPTSVLVTSPQSGEATALYYSEKEYGQLQRLLGPEGTGSRDTPPELESTQARQINVTWLAHDISPWRLDRIFPDGTGSRSIWIHTAANVPETPNGYWHRAEHPDRLRALLGRLGVLGKATGGDGYSGIFPAPWQSESPGDTAAEESATTRVSITTEPEGDGTDWWWAIPGAAAGAVLALVLRPVAARVTPVRWRREREPGPRQELRDV
ncbi:hypothetical protein [Streptomyces brasiliensis]|uniref:hypothetical protein n=1 Tax=Streptomyces brasiliensis TaxID=1954 RepID=UPI001E53B171|nr:hypothetical protein [Streptomyces brasiliensis]